MQALMVAIMLLVVLPVMAMVVLTVILTVMAKRTVVKLITSKTEPKPVELIIFNDSQSDNPC